jgi:hypothetical protein
LNCIASDGENLGLAPGDVFYHCSDTNIFGFGMVPPSTMTFTGVNVGSALLLITRADQSIVRIPSVQLPSLTIVVTP